VTSFTSKFDAVLAKKAQFTPQEQQGYDLFRGKARCNECHRDGGPGEDRYSQILPPAISALPPIRGFPTMAKIGPTRWAMSPIAGIVLRRWGVGNFLSNGHLLSQPSAVDARWLKLAPDNQARMQVPTLRNVDKRPDPAFVKAYGHNGYFTSLKQIVHFYNTRDVLPRCHPMIRAKVRPAGQRRSRPPI